MAVVHLYIVRSQFTVSPFHRYRRQRVAFNLVQTKETKWNHLQSCVADKNDRFTSLVYFDYFDNLLVANIPFYTVETTVQRPGWEHLSHFCIEPEECSQFARITAQVSQ